MNKVDYFSSFAALHAKSADIRDVKTEELYEVHATRPEDAARSDQLGEPVMEGCEPSDPQLVADGQLKQRRELQPLECKEQQLIHGRQVLCIDDPMERGRSLGASFQGNERLSFEHRRACQLLTPNKIGDVASEEAEVKKLANLFLGQPPPPKILWKLLEQRTFPVLLAGEPEVERTLAAPGRSCGRILGTGGSRIKELQDAPGITAVRLSDGPPGSDREIRIRGSEKAVDECVRLLQQIIGQDGQAAGPSERVSGRNWYSNGPKGSHTGKGEGSRTAHEDYRYDHGRPTEGWGEYDRRTAWSARSETSGRNSEWESQHADSHASNSSRYNDYKGKGGKNPQGQGQKGGKADPWSNWRPH